MAFDDTKNEHGPQYLVDRYGLAERPGDLILQALDDINTVGRTPGYAIKFFKWHHYEEETKTCSVCLAGAVAANRLRVAFDQDWTPNDENRLRGFGVRQKMNAIDRFRVGDLSGLKALGYDTEYVRYNDKIFEAFPRVYEAFVEMERRSERTARAAGEGWNSRNAATDVNTPGFRRWEKEMRRLAAVLNEYPLPASLDKEYASQGEDYTMMGSRARQVLKNWNAVGMMEFTEA